MMPISELVEFATRLDKRGHPIALKAARLWGRSEVQFVRSSACHVFMASSRDGVRLALRLRPSQEASALESGSHWARRLADLGGPVARPVLSETGRMVEMVDGYACEALEWIDGEPLGDALDAVEARAWGAALARLHKVGVLLGDGAPVTHTAVETPTQWGLVHGDPESDNVIRSAHGLIFVDPDGFAAGSYIGDAAFALRDWAPLAGPPDWDHPVPSAFLEGYRTIRPLDEADIASVPDLAAAAAIAEYERLKAIIETPDPEWPEWAIRLDAAVRTRVRGIRAALNAQPGSDLR